MLKELFKEGLELHSYNLVSQVELAKKDGENLVKLLRDDDDVMETDLQDGHSLRQRDLETTISAEKACIFPQGADVLNSEFVGLGLHLPRGGWRM